MKRLAVGIIFLCVLSVGFFTWNNKAPENGVYHVVLTDTGYEPDELEIPLGSTIVFSTTREKYHWPASNLHPDHAIYPEFDPLEPVAPDESWSFTFEKLGRWNFHDHLRSYYRGSIKVTEVSQ